MIEVGEFPGGPDRGGLATKFNTVCKINRKKRNDYLSVDPVFSIYSVSLAQNDSCENWQPSPHVTCLYFKDIQAF